MCYVHEYGPDGSPAVGLVDMKRYGDWLAGQGAAIQFWHRPHRTFAARIAMKLRLNTIKILLGSLAAVAVAISIAMSMGVTMCSPGTGNAGPGMTVSFGGTVKGMRVHIKDARLPDGKEFPSAGSFGESNSPLSGGATMGAAPDGRQLPEWVDFTWSQPPYPEDPAQTLEQYRALPVKTQRVPIRSRIPQALVEDVTEANRHPVGGHGTEKRLAINLVWTSQGIKMRWRLLRVLLDGRHVYPREGGDELAHRPDALPLRSGA
jgi:hypothetical protein